MVRPRRGRWQFLKVGNAVTTWPNKPHSRMYSPAQWKHTCTQTLERAVFTPAKK